MTDEGRSCRSSQTSSGSEPTPVAAPLDARRRVRLDVAADRASGKRTGNCAATANQERLRRWLISPARLAARNVVLAVATASPSAGLLILSPLAGQLCVRYAASPELVDRELVGLGKLNAGRGQRGLEAAVPGLLPRGL